MKKKLKQTFDFNTMDILAVADKLAGTNVTKVLIKILNKKSIQKYITDLNTKVQLFDYGEDSRGVQLAAIGGGYAPSTIRIKRKKNQPANRVTLKDTGDFYKSFDITVHANASFTIGADTDKGDTDLTDRWGSEIVGLNGEHVTLVLELLEEEFYKEVLKGVK